MSFEGNIIPLYEANDFKDLDIWPSVVYSPK